MALVTPTEPVPLGELGRVHFAGLGGAGMSGIARIMLARGVEVSGSDTTAESVALTELAALGARVCVGHAAGHLGDADTLVVSSAIRAGNPELVEANRRGLRVVHRAAALASLMVGRQVIAVTGTHGKTSTTSMIATVLIETSEAGAEPAYAIGGVLAATGVGAADGDGPYFVAEADESDGSFLMYSPDIAVVTNVDADHLDNYGTEAAYRASFAAFLGRVKPGGLLVTCADDAGTRDLAGQARALGLRVVSYGESPDADYRIGGVRTSGMETSFTLRAEPPAGQSRPGPFGKIDLDLQLRVPGRHNALNATAAFAAAMELGIEPARIATALASYRGAARRLEPKGEARGVRVLDTYAHHPTELAADLRAARDITTGGGRVIAVFQPHLFSRTRIFAAELGAALGLADEAVVLDVYAAREDPEPGVTGALVAGAVPGGAARYVPGFADVPAVVAALARPGDLVLTMGAGDITKMGPLVLDEIAASAATTP
ncbi:MAG TPA: UDP-N-acetylmuramate--L-alanine ligase [Trebonia sp.]|nr:UDP-N-acetylmuramate--L-alanine ligase [Trebonia sp.]